jgi:cobalamin biosynthesis protein CobD/CbiB
MPQNARMATSQTLLTAIEAAIEALLTGGASSYSIGSRSVTKLDLGELIATREKLRNEVSRETNGIMRLARMGRTSR